ncbi:hypothetical protein F511_39659 [Dorcoceras hygrometricum]|uniref:Uncharacterized protein n=1 Tax=Dorcoceras hygrometricum TaxID=472368 RepID=A0A2Z7BV98_9LAMI|nr:hypothetical protein F511_39659 [Dorcoceras hygrometricum]
MDCAMFACNSGDRPHDVRDLRARRRSTSRNDLCVQPPFVAQPCAGQQPSIAQPVREASDFGRPLCACDARAWAVKIATLLETRAWLRPVSRGNRHFTVDCGRLHQSGPRPETGFLHQPALEGLTRSARTDSPRQDWPETIFRRREAAAAAFGEEGGRRTLALGITDSACKNQLVVVSVQYGPFNPYIPIRSTTIGKSRVAVDPIAMHTSWRSNSDIASVTRVSITFRVVRTNQYNQDLGLIHSTNGNHLESPNEGSSIDHQRLTLQPDPTSRKLQELLATMHTSPQAVYLTSLLLRLSEKGYKDLFNVSVQRLQGEFLI